MCVLLPVHRIVDASSLRRAFQSIAGQSLRDIQIQLIANGSDSGTISLLRELADSDRRATLVEIPEANLAAALNKGMQGSGSELVARMDADDWSHPERLRIQRAFMACHPEVAAVGCSWERVGAGGKREQVDVPADPAEIRWRLLLDNPLAHGSMMLRKSMVQTVGGYDPACRRAQDYDLWLRLAAKHPIAAVPEVLYEYRTRHSGGREDSVAEQGHTAARSLVEAWSRLAPATGEAHGVLAASIGPLLAGGHGFNPAAAQIEALLRSEGPSSAALIARLWVGWQESHRTSITPDICRRARLREVFRAMAAAGARGVKLWGAGKHSAWLLEHRAELPIPVVGLVDDVVADADRYGFRVEGPGSLEAGDWALISSDGFEELIWQASQGARERGVHVWRIYGNNPEDVSADKGEET